MPIKDLLSKPDNKISKDDPFRNTGPEDLSGEKRGVQEFAAGTATRDGLDVASWFARRLYDIEEPQEIRFLSAKTTVSKVDVKQAQWVVIACSPEGIGGHAVLDASRWIKEDMGEAGLYPQEYFTGCGNGSYRAACEGFPWHGGTWRWQGEIHYHGDGLRMRRVFVGEWAQLPDWRAGLDESLGGE